MALHIRRLPIVFALFYFAVFSVFIVAAIVGNRAISVMTQSAQVENRHTIVIDAGHGGEDGGATSCTGILESNINLEIALRLNDLMHLLGFDTVMVRTTDAAIHTQGNTIAARKASDLKARVQLANGTENGLLISIHQNYFTDERYSGAQVFFPKTAGSEWLAKSLQNELVAILNPGSNRKAKSASGIYLMENISCTGVLIEWGFLSNHVEEAKLRSPDYQKKLCCVIASTVGGFLLSQ